MICALFCGRVRVWVDLDCVLQHRHRELRAVCECARMCDRAPPQTPTHQPNPPPRRPPARPGQTNMMDNLCPTVLFFFFCLFLRIPALLPSVCAPVVDICWLEQKLGRGLPKRGLRGRAYARARKGVRAHSRAHARTRRPGHGGEPGVAVGVGGHAYTSTLTRKDERSHTRTVRAPEVGVETWAWR